MTALERLLVSVLAAVVLLAGGALAVHAYGAHRYGAGRAAAIAERAQADAAAVLKRMRENAAQAVHQGETNTNITKEKDDEIADLRQRLAAAPRLRVGPSICPDRHAAPAQAESPASGDGADPSAGLVSSRADADFKHLIEAVEQDLATGRACQAFLKQNDFEP
jgi:prophage endopeptidase